MVMESAPVIVNPWARDRDRIVEPTTTSEQHQAMLNTVATSVQQAGHPSFTTGHATPPSEKPVLSDSTTKAVGAENVGVEPQTDLFKENIASEGRNMRDYLYWLFRRLIGGKTDKTVRPIAQIGDRILQFRNKKSTEIKKQLVSTGEEDEIE